MRAPGSITSSPELGAVAPPDFRKAHCENSLPIARVLSKEYFRHMATEPRELNYPWPVRRVTDPKELRALAHPVRFALLDLLAEQPLTASQCGARLGESPANCSYHLRQLAKYGHVHPVEGGRGRERYWAMRDGGISIADDGPGGEAAATVFGQAVDEYRMAAWRAFVARRPYEPESWRSASLSTDLVSWLTADELNDIAQGLYNLVAPYAARDQAPFTRPEGSRAVRLFAYAFPGAPAPTPVAPHVSEAPPIADMPRQVPPAQATPTQ